MNHVSKSFKPTAIDRPDPALLKYYALCALMSGPAFPFVFLPLYFKYHTLRYALDKDGISMSWGILFRKEIHLTFRRIQDIHLTRNFVQRWLGLATVAIQTASGKSGPEMSIEGILEAEPLRDFLYTKMRGAHGDPALQDSESDQAASVGSINNEDEALVLLTEIRDALQESRGGSQQASQPVKS